MHSIFPCLYYPLSGTVWHGIGETWAVPVLSHQADCLTQLFHEVHVECNTFDSGGIPESAGLPINIINVWKLWKHTLFFCSFPPLSVTNCHVSPFGTKHLRISVSVVTGQPGWKQRFQAYQHILQHQIWLLVNVQYLYAKEWPLTLSTWVENCVRPWVTLPAKPHEPTIIVIELCNPQPNYQEHRTCRSRFRSYRLIQIAGSKINPKKLRPSATICD